MGPRPEDLAATLVRRARQRQARADERLADARAAAEVRRIRPGVDAGLERLDSHLEETIQALRNIDA